MILSTRNPHDPIVDVVQLIYVDLSVPQYCQYIADTMAVYFSPLSSGFSTLPLGICW